MIAAMPGHCQRSPGSTAGITHDEHHYNMIIVNAIREAWHDLKFFNGLVFETSDAKTNWIGIKKRHKLCKAAGVNYAVEIHHNSKYEGASTFFRRGCGVGRGVSSFLKKSLMPYALAFGAKRWPKRPLPDSRYGKKWIVEQSDFPCVILECAKLDDPDQQGYFHNLAIIGEYGRLIALTLKAHYMGEELNYG